DGVDLLLREERAEVRHAPGRDAAHAVLLVRLDPVGDPRVLLRDPLGAGELVDDGAVRQVRAERARALRRREWYAALGRVEVRPASRVAARAVGLEQQVPVRDLRGAVLHVRVTRLPRRDELLGLLRVDLRVLDRSLRVRDVLAVELDRRLQVLVGRVLRERGLVLGQLLLRAREVVLRGLHVGLRGADHAVEIALLLLLRLRGRQLDALQVRDEVVHALRVLRPAAGDTPRRHRRA